MYDEMALLDRAENDQLDADRGGQQTTGSCPTGALDIIFRREHDGLVRYLRARVGPELACDIAQDVFMRVAASGQADLLENPRSFLYRVARNILIDRSRRERCRIVTLPLAEAIDTGCAADQDQELEADDLRAGFKRALGGLSAKTRQIFIMHRIDERPYREIQTELGISLAGVEYHMMKALAHLRATLTA